MTKKEQKKFIGLTIDEAKKIYDTIRVVVRDGKPCIITHDMRMDRMNVEIKDGKIVAVVKFG